MLYKRDFYTLFFFFKSLHTPSARSVASLPRQGPQTNVPPSRFCPSKTQCVPARLPLHILGQNNSGGGGAERHCAPPNANVKIRAIIGGNSGRIRVKIKCTTPPPPPPRPLSEIFIGQNMPKICVPQTKQKKTELCPTLTKGSNSGKLYFS